LFEEEDKQGALDLIILSPLSPYTFIFAKLMGLWLSIACPLSLLSLGIAFWYGFPAESLLWFPVINSLSLFYIACLMILGGLLVLKAQARFLLLPFLLLPFNIPNFILSMAIVEAHALEIPIPGPLGMLIGLLLILFPFTIISGGFLLKDTLRSLN